MKLLYRVSFTFNSDYRPKSPGVVSITLVVESSDQFTALADAWLALSPLTLPEPVEFNAQRIERS